jgi:LysR family transcriptional regulator for metE and metH
VVAAASRNTLSSLHQRTVDLIIISGEINPAGIKLVPMFEDQLRFVMPPGHRLADKAYIEGADIVGEDFITYTRVPEPDREYERLFRPSNAYPNWIETVEVPEAIVEMVAAGLGTSVLAGWAVSAAIDSGRIVAARVGEQGIDLVWYAATRSGNSNEDERNQRVAELLARWCQLNGGLSGG